MNLLSKLSDRNLKRKNVKAWAWKSMQGKSTLNTRKFSMKKRGANKMLKRNMKDWTVKPSNKNNKWETSFDNWKLKERKSKFLLMHLKERQEKLSKPTSNLNKEYLKEKVRFKPDWTNWKGLKPTMKRLKKSFDNLKDNLISTKWKLTSYCQRLTMKEEKLWQMKKAQTEKFAAWRRKRRNCKLESKGKPKEATTTKPC